MKNLHITFIGLTITSSWGNGHATTYRGLVRELSALGHQVSFLEKDTPWYRSHRDLSFPEYCKTGLYENLRDLIRRYVSWIEGSDLLIIGSYVAETPALVRWARQHTHGCLAYYDIDTPVTLSKLAAQDYEYIDPGVIPVFDLYLSFSGGAILERIVSLYDAAAVRPLYCSADTTLYQPDAARPAGEAALDLGYLGTYSEDRQDALDRLLVSPARSWPQGRFAVAGALYPAGLAWPGNVLRTEHLSPPEHRSFYNSQRFTLNVTRQPMVDAGYSPSVRLFEAGACGVPVITDYWKGLEEFFEPQTEILVAESSEQVLDYLRNIPEEQRLDIAARARERVLRHHTAAVRARELLQHVAALTCDRTAISPAGAGADIPEQIQEQGEPIP